MTYIKPTCPACKGQTLLHICETSRVVLITGAAPLDLAPETLCVSEAFSKADQVLTERYDCAECGHSGTDLVAYFPTLQAGKVTPGTGNDDPAVSV